MITLYVHLKIRDFNAFEQFEREAVKIMYKYRGRIVHAFEIIRNADNSGEEIHILEFPNSEAFSAYRADHSLAALSTLRNRAISATEIKSSIRLKSYED